MYVIRQASERDIAVIFKFTCDLVDYHRNMTQYFLMSEEAMMAAFREGCFECLILFEKKDGGEEEERAVGYLLYIEEYSHLHGYGYYIDDFFVSRTLRGKGLGKMLMHHMYKTAVERKASFLKLVFDRSIIGLEKTYVSLGFDNVTATEKGVSLYELFGDNNIRKMIYDVPDDEKQIKESCSENDFHFIVKRKVKGMS